ncbi:MAG: tetraacyldisaccharide 4'-kinase [Bacteroidales bacterium]
MTVAVDANRRNGIKLIRDSVPETEVVILDDAFQHRWVKPGLSIVVTDYNRLFTRDYLLPYGRLREHRSGITRADLILVSKTPPDISPIDRRLIVREIAPQDNQNLYFTAIDYLDPVNIHSGEPAGMTMAEMGEMGSHILLVTGIASPEPLRKYIEQSGADIEHIVFNDHHIFSTADLELIRRKYDLLPAENRCIITTEKDSVRLRETNNLRELFDDNFYYLPISIKFLNNDKEEFDNHIIQYVRKDKANRNISRVEGN